MYQHFGVKAVTDILRGKKHLINARPEKVDHRKHLDAGADWLMTSIVACDGKASSKGYKFGRGWMPAYPETTGYIVPTLLNLDDLLDKPALTEAAQSMGVWLAGIQRPDGGYSGYELGHKEAPDVFDSGMILLGFNALLHKDADTPVANAAKRVAEFLVKALDDDGAFARHVSHNMLHTYNVRSAWALVAYGKLVDNEAATKAGLANVDWTLIQQLDNGFFGNNAFKPTGNSNTHGTAYVLRGLLQIYGLTGRSDILDSVNRGVAPLVALLEQHGWLAAEIGPDWTFRSRHICLTGCAQLAIVLLRLAGLTGKTRYVETAEKLIAQVAVTQNISAKGTRHFGAIAGSYPIFGAYAPLQYPNWATKFFVDALILRNQCQAGEQRFRSRDLYAG